MNSDTPSEGNSVSSGRKEDDFDGLEIHMTYQLQRRKLGMTSIDLNCDMGESYGTYVLGYDEQTVPYVTSINVACGFHASDRG